MEVILFCPNEDCPEHCRQVFESPVSTDSYSLFLFKKCPICGSQRNIISENEAGNGFSLAINTISSMNPYERKEILKKRSSEHFEKNIKENKKYLDNKLMKGEQ